MGERREDQCIERCGPAGRRWFYSVSEYEQATEEARDLENSPIALTSRGLYWTPGAPRLEDLTPEWQATKLDRFRICDPELYDEQMREFVGLASAGIR